MAKIGKPTELQEAKIEELRRQIEAYTQRQKKRKHKSQSVKVIRRKMYET